MSEASSVVTSRREYELAFCAFVDLLGFGNIVLDEWERANQLYGRAMAREGSPVGNLVGRHDTVEMKVLSDAVILVGTDPIDVLLASGSLLENLLKAGIAVRGGIGCGRHKERSDGKNFFIVSQALTAAYRAESKLARAPRVVVDPAALPHFAEVLSQDMPNDHGRLREMWSYLLVQSEDSLWSVNPFPDVSPFGPQWLESRGVAELLRRHANGPFADKYLWLGDLWNFLACFSILKNQARLSEYYVDDLAYINWLKNRKEQYENIGLTDPYEYEEYVDTWTYTNIFNKFFIPYLLPNRPTTEVRRRAFLSSFTENVRSVQAV